MHSQCRHKLAEVVHVTNQAGGRLQYISVRAHPYLRQIQLTIYLIHRCQALTVSARHHAAKPLLNAPIQEAKSECHKISHDIDSHLPIQPTARTVHSPRDLTNCK